jgi:hypothetical protein
MSLAIAGAVTLSDPSSGSDESDISVDEAKQNRKHGEAKQNQPAATHDKFRTLPELSPLLGVSLAMNMDQYWKYVVVECAEFGFSASSAYPRFSRQTVYDFYFGGPKIMRFKINGAVDDFHGQFHGTFAESINGTTNGMLNQQGVAMHMFALSNIDQITEKAYEKKLSKYPLHLCTIGSALFKAQQRSTCPRNKEWHEFKGSYLMYGTGDTFLINPTYGAALHTERPDLTKSGRGERAGLVTSRPNVPTPWSQPHRPSTGLGRFAPDASFDHECVVILSVMRLHLLSHVDAIKDMDVITSSTLLNRTSPPGLWCKLMRAPTHKRAVEKMLRMPLLFNELVAYSLRKNVTTCIQKLLSGSDPLSDTV